MTHDALHYFTNVLTGSQRGPTAAALRLALATLEPFYAGFTALRNGLYSAGVLRSTRLPRPVISIGNLTAGGTGKTPMVRWLAGKLRDNGVSVAVLSRGYKSAAGQLGDEQLMLDRLLNAPALQPVVLKANPNRIAAAEAVLRDEPETRAFLLDDGFQHRRVARDLDIVLLNAADPFGCNHVLPRGLLREPVGGLRRAGAVVITHAGRVSESSLLAIEQRVRRFNQTAPIYRAVHAHTGLRTAGASAALAPDRRLEDLRGRRFFAFSGIGSPALLHQQLESISKMHSATYVGSRWFADHHAYTDADLAQLQAQAAASKADLLLTTEKDWVKVVQLPSAAASKAEMWRIDVEMRLLDDGATRLFQQVMDAVGPVS
jgi:tetraacyldisaccharide 4'-kinase